MPTFQVNVSRWCKEAFGEKDATDKRMRTLRFLEEALELAQAMEITEEEAQRVLRYVFGRPIGEAQQEMGGVMVSLAALAGSQKLSMYGCGEIELIRCWQKIDQIRERHAAKPSFDSTDGKRVGHYAPNISYRMGQEYVDNNDPNDHMTKLMSGLLNHIDHLSHDNVQLCQCGVHLLPHQRKMGKCDECAETSV